MKAFALFPLILVAYALGWIVLGAGIVLNVLAETAGEVVRLIMRFLEWATD